MSRPRSREGVFVTRITRMGPNGYEEFVRGDYSGGPYIELTFGSHFFAPTEVINVWDYNASQPGDPLLRSKDRSVVVPAVRAHVLAWMNDMDQEWPEWYDGYLENARHG